MRHLARAVFRPVVDRDDVQPVQCVRVSDAHALLDPLHGRVDELARLGVEREADGDDGQPARAIRLGIALLADLGERVRRRRVDLQLENVDAARVRRDEVTAACRLRDFGVVPKALRGEQHAEGPRVGKLVLPLEALVRTIGQLRVEGLEAVEERIKLARAQLAAERGRPLRILPRVGPREERSEVLPHLLVRDAECIEPVGAVRDREVTRLVEKPDRLDVREVGDVEVGIDGIDLAVGVDGKRPLAPDVVHQRRGAPRRRPRRLEPRGRGDKRQRNRDGVVDRDRVLVREAVAVEPALQLGAERLIRQSHPFRLGVQVPLEVRGQLLLRVAVERGVVGLEGDVVEAGERREDRELRELRDARDVEEADLPRVVLELRVDGREPRADPLGEVHVRQCLRHRVVVLVDQDRRAHAVLLIEEVDGPCEVGRGRNRGVIRIARRMQRVAHGDCQRPLERREVRNLHPAPVEVDDGMGLPVVVGLRDREAVEELPVAEEDRLQRRHAQGLAEPTRTRAEEERAARLRDEPVQVRRLVNVEQALLAQGLEVGDVGGDWLHARIIAHHRAVRLAARD